MFKKTSKTPQLNLFTSPKSLLSGKSLSLYEDNEAWHNQFYQQVTARIDENIFRPLYCENNGTPNASVRILITMMILKEAEGLSDQKLFENCRFNMLTRSAIGLLNADDSVPTESTYYLFRKRIVDFEKAGNENLFNVVFAQITKNQSIDFEVSGKRIRMDSKLLGSNIAWLSRYELIHETLRLFYNQVKQLGKLDKSTKEKLDRLLKLEGNKVVYTCSSEEVKIRFKELGELTYKILPLFSPASGTYYPTLQRVFNEQYKVDENKVAIGREKEEISTQSVQSPHDTDCHYRNKDGNKVKGYSINVTESCDDKGLNLIGSVDVKKVSASDVDFLQLGIKRAQEVFPDKIEYTHADGAYHSPDNQQFCETNDINLYLHAIQGMKGRYQFNFLKNGDLAVLDTITNQIIASKKVTCKNGSVKWRIRTGENYRYFTQKEIDTYLIRKKIAETPIEILQKRNNVEATIFQLGYHYSNGKSRYRGEIKHQMWANIRCLWVNFVRILKYIKQVWQKSTFLSKYALQSACAKMNFAFKSFLLAILPYHLKNQKNIQCLII
ncbi:MAG: transposase [Lutibacter sp.]|nr:transposase [Lutibacter sp.]